MAKNWGPTVEKKLSALGNSWVVLFQPSQRNQYSDNAKLVSLLMGKMGFDCIYVSLSKTHSQLLDVFRKEGIDADKVCFADAATVGTGLPRQSLPNVVYINSPKYLTDLSVAIDAFGPNMIGKKSVVLFDSLSSLLLYHPPQTVARFSQFLSTKMRGDGKNGAFVYLEEHPQIHAELLETCDGSFSTETT